MSTSSLSVPSIAVPSYCLSYSFVESYLKSDYNFIGAGTISSCVFVQYLAKGGLQIHILYQAIKYLPTPNRKTLLTIYTVLNQEKKTKKTKIQKESHNHHETS